MPPRIVPIVSVVVLVLAPAALAAAADTPDARMSEQAATKEVSVPRWLLLGPASDPLPVFGEEKPGAYGIEDLLKAERFPRSPRWPAEGAEVSWFAGRALRWSIRGSGADGQVALDLPAGSEGDSATAWLAAYVTVPRWTTYRLEVKGVHPRRAWLDGEPIAMGGTGKDEKPAEVKGTLKLWRGKHLLLLQTVRDPARQGEWRAGAALLPEDDGGPIDVAFDIDPLRDLTLTDVLDPDQISALAVSPEGKEAAVSITRVIPGTDDSESRVEIRRISDGAILRTLRGAPAAAQLAWDPAGKWLSYVTKEKPGDNELATLWLVDRKGGEVVPLLQRVENFGSYLWSPEGKSIAWSATVKREADKRGVKRLEGLLDRQRDHRTLSYLHLVTVPDGTSRRLTAGSLSTGGASFAPDGSRLLVLRESDDFTSRPFTRKELWEVDLRSFRARKLREARWLESAQYSPDGKQILVQAGPSEFGTAGTRLPEGVIPNESDGDLYIWEPVSSQVVALTSSFDPAVVSAFWSPADGRIYVKAEDRDLVRLYRCEPDRGTLAPIETGFDVLQEVAFAERAPVAVVSGTSPWRPEEAASIDLVTGAARPFLKPAENALAGVRRGSVESWGFATAAGRTIDGRIYFPPDFDRARPEKWPAIVYYYGGTSPVTRDFGGRYPKEWWAANGYVVYVPQPSGATGFGQAFSALHVNDWGETTAGEVIEGLQRFLEAHPFVDPKKVGCIGASYGGFLTQRILTRTDAFAAAVSHAGISALSSYWGEGYWGYSYNAVAAAGSFPWNRPDIFVDRSPLFRADRIKTPLLLTHGASDTNVPVGESDAMYTALRLLGVPVEYVQIEGMDHIIMDHAKRIVWSKTILAWFDRWLKGEPQAWDDLYPAAK